MNMVGHADTAAQRAIQVFVASPDGQAMGTGPLDGLRVLDLVGFVVGELAVAVTSASGSLLADAGRKMTRLGALLGSLWTVRHHVAEDSPAADRAQCEAPGCPPC